MFWIACSLAVEFFMIYSYRFVKKNELLKKIDIVAINFLWILIILFAMLGVGVLYIVSDILGEKKKENDIVEFLTCLGMSLIFVLLFCIIARRTMLPEHIANVIRSILITKNLELDIISASLFVFLTLLKMILDFSFGLIIMFRKNKGKWMKNDLKKTELFLLLIFLVLFIFKMIPDFDYIEYQDEVINILTFYTAIMLYIDKREVWTEK